MSTNKIIPIFFTFDNNYVEPAAVAFYSLLNTAKKGVFYEMFVAHSNITEEKQTLLQNIINRFDNANISFINTNGFLNDMFKNGSFTPIISESNSVFTADTIVRCFASKFFPQYEKIIYSDVDILVTDDLSELYEIDLQDKYIAGVKNPFIKYANELSHLSTENFEMLKDIYIAGGIWVMNLKKIREDNLEQRMQEIIEDKSIIKKWNDQDIINIACQGKVEFIPLNYISYPYMYDLLQNSKFESHYTKEELYDSIINPKIIHYAAAKPWNDYVRYAINWWTIFDYLNLKPTKIFKVKNPQQTTKHALKMRNRYRKYLKCALLFVFIEFIVILLQLFIGG